MLRALAAAVLLVSLGTREAAADDVGALSSDSFPYRHGHGRDVDGGLQFGFPTALPTGLSRGLGGGFTEGRCPYRWGARIAWLTATEYAPDWKVTQSDLRLRVSGQLQHDAGRGSLALRLSAGGPLVHETRDRNQGIRAGLTGSDLEMTAFAFVPAADLEAVVM